MISARIMEQLKATEHQLVGHLDGDVREIFATMVGVEISSSQSVTTITRFTDSVTAMVAFAGCYNGMVSITAPQSLAMAFASQMLGMDVLECDDEVRDALGEIAKNGRRLLQTPL